MIECWIHLKCSQKIYIILFKAKKECTCIWTCNQVCFIQKYTKILHKKQLKTIFSMKNNFMMQKNSIVSIKETKTQNNCRFLSFQRTLLMIKLCWIWLVDNWPIKWVIVEHVENSILWEQFLINFSSNGNHSIGKIVLLRSKQIPVRLLVPYRECEHLIQQVKLTISQQIGKAET